MKAFVTGGTGFIGHHLIARLLAGKWQVRALIRHPGSREQIYFPQVDWVQGDVGDPASLSSTLTGVDVVFHLAGSTYSPTREKYFRVHSLGTKNLVEACLNGNALQRFLYISSLAAVGPSRDSTPLVETDPPQPMTWYGESKLEGEQQVRGLEGKIPFTILRPPIVFGPREKGLFRLFRLIRRGILPIFGNSENRYSFIYVEDLVEGMVQLALHPRTENEIFFISMDTNHGWEEIGVRVAELVKKHPWKITISPAVASLAAYISEGLSFLRGGSLFNHQKVLEMKQTYWICSPRKAKAVSGWETKYSMHQALEKTIRWYQTNGWL